MPREITDDELKRDLKARFNQLPKVVQDAITSADIEKHLRELADTNKLHLDQWELLENEVMLTLMGFDESKNLTANLKKNLTISDELAASLAADISKIVFEPIRTELERELGEQGSGFRDQVSGDSEQGGQGGKIGEAVQEHAAVSAPAAVVPATPPPAPPEGRAMRAPISESYEAGQPSHARKIVDGDPYREQVS